MTDASDPSELPLDRAPLGARAGRALIDALAGKHDSIVERYLERKGRIDLTDRRALAKLAKFILGAANREPAEAARYFEGYGVMVIGMSSDGEVEGAKLPDPEQWEDGITRFIGVDGPRWDINPVKHPDAEDSVLILLVDPPKRGDPVQVCRADGEKIDDGRVYIRRRGKTVQADSAEMQMLFTRAAATDPKMELDVSLVGEAVPVTIDLEASFEEYLARKREELLTAMPEPEPEQEAGETLGPLGSGLAGLGIAGLQNNTMAELAKSMRPTFEMSTESQRETNWSALGLTEKPEPRSEREYRDEIDQWTREIHSKIPEAVDRMAAYILDAVMVRVHNKSEVYLEDVEITIHLQGDVRAVDWYELERDVPRRNYFDLPSPPRKWGPVKYNMLPHGIANAVPPWQPGPLALGSPSVSWDNTESVTIEASVDTLPPRKLHRDGSGEFVLLVPAGHTEEVRGTWTATAKGHHKLYEGELVIPVSDELDVTGPFRKWLGIER